MQDRARSNQKLAPDRVDPIRIPVRACCVVFAQSQVPGLGDGLFDRCAVYLFQSRWRAFVARSQHGLVRTGGFLQSEALSRIQLCNPRYMVPLRQLLRSRLFTVLSTLLAGTNTVQKCWYLLGLPMTEFKVRLALTAD